MKRRHKFMTMAAALAELSVGVSSQAAAAEESSPSKRISSAEYALSQRPIYQVLDGTGFEMFRLLGKGRALKDIAFYFSIAPGEATRRLNIIQEQIGCKTHAALARKAAAWVREHDPA